MAVKKLPVVLFRWMLFAVMGIPITFPAAYADVPVIQSLDSYQNTILDSGGELLEEQAAYRVNYYDIDLYIDPADRSVHGSVISGIELVDASDTFVVHLDSVFTTHRMLLIHADEQPEPLDFIHEDGLIIGSFKEEIAEGNRLAIEIVYSGKPRPAPNPPWEGGITWAETENGEPWIGVSCQMNGADIWWPVKDHPTDRPDSVSVKLTVPAGLKAISNGSLQTIQQYSEDTRTFHWKTRYPINNYAVTMNIAPYVELRRSYQSINGESFPVYFWALPENRDKAEELLIQVMDHMRFFEELLGPYPFRKEKYGIAESPFLGMEHQTLIAYGAGYQNDVVFGTDSEFDDLHHHELAHEWWGNLITVYDWKDFWIHEGFATYMQPLYAEQMHGEEQYHHFMREIHHRISNNMPIAPRTTRTTREMFDGRDIYMKGAWILHTLRGLIGDEDFFMLLRRMTYPDPEQEGKSIKSPGRFVDTDDFIELSSDISGKRLEWFFETYLRHAELPRLQKRWEENKLYLSWSTPSDNPFPMPVKVYDGRDYVTVVPEDEISVAIHDRDTYRIDPGYRVLREGMFR